MLRVALFSVGYDWSFLRIEDRVYGENSDFYMYTCATVCMFACANKHNVCREKLEKEIKTLLWILMSLFSVFMTRPLVRCLLSGTARSYCAGLQCAVTVCHHQQREGVPAQEAENLSFRMLLTKN